MFTRLKNVCAILLALTLVSACGGGSGGGGVSPPPPPPPPTGGITRTGVAIAVGPITGFGSVIVNGVRYETTAATSFTKDGLEGLQQSDFSVGEFVVITGTIDDDNFTNAVATTVEFDDAVEGPVSSVDSVAGTFVALGQTVVVSPGTSIDDSCPAGLDALLGVVAVEVSGPVMADGSIAATRYECKGVLGEMEVTGLVSNLNAGALTFDINALTVDYSSAMLDNFPGGTISDGDPVEAKGVNLISGPPLTLTATKVEFKGARFAEDEGDHIEVEGFITAFVSATDFDVTGIPATTDSNTSYEGGTAADLGLNIKVEVEGEFNSAGVLLGTKVEFKQAKNVRVAGIVDMVGADSLVILDITITTDPILTRFEDKTNADVDPLRITDIVAGNYVEVRGQEFPAGSGELAAVLLEREDAAEDTELRGFVEVGGANRPDVTVLGVTISTGAGTVYRDTLDQPMLPDDFWAAVSEGTLLEAKGTETSVNTMFAAELELED